MNPEIRWLVLSGAVAVSVLLASCRRQPPVSDSLQGLAGAFPAASSTNAAPDPAASDPSQFVRAALQAARQNDYAGGVIALQAVQQATRLSASQLRAVQAAMAALTSDLVERAEKGDRQAQADLAAIERTRSQ